MKYGFSLALASASLCISATAVAQTSEPEEEAEEAEVPEGEQIRCRRISITGSRVRRTRICMTASEWAQQGRRGNDTVRELMRNNSLDPARDP